MFETLNSFLDEPSKPRVKPGVLTTVPSDSDPDKSYAITVGNDNVIYCSCMAYKFSGKNGNKKTCKHLRKFLADHPKIANLVD